MTRLASFDLSRIILFIFLAFSNYSSLSAIKTYSESVTEVLLL